MNQQILLGPQNNGLHLDAYGGATIDANGQVVNNGYGLQQQQQPQPQQQVQYQQYGNTASNDPYANLGFSVPAPGLSPAQYVTRNGSDGVVWNQTTNDIPADGYFSLDPTLHLKLQSFPMLDSTATQVISTFARSSFQEIVYFITDPQSDRGQAYATIKGLFEETKKTYSREHAFLDPVLLGVRDPQHHDAIRKANLATFMTNIFGSNTDVNLYVLHDRFLDTFVPYGSRMLKWHGALFLELKTQAYISTVLHAGAPHDNMIEELFPRDMERRLLERRLDAKQLVPSEQDFINRLNTRRQYLVAEYFSPNGLVSLPRKYNWTQFLQELSNCISRNLEVSDGGMNRPPIYNQNPMSNGYVQPQESPRQLSNPQMPPPRLNTTGRPLMEGEDHIRNAALAAHAALIKPGQGPGATQSIHRSPSTSSNASMIPPFRGNSLPSPASATDASSPVIPDQMNALYSRPRQTPAPNNPSLPTPANSSPATSSATARTQPASSNPLPAPRRPWTSEEEAALLAGLERVRGPHWSAILALHGAGGSVSEVLKDRNQVQLKDKARNLKLWFLKSQREVPEALKGVTGELKTRKGSSADPDGGSGGGGSSGGRKQSGDSSTSSGSTGKRLSETPNFQPTKRPAR
ncbi:MAG: TTAGGG repeat binding factor [Bogoriella megaspora]|nr:MAG: TTAGGG repeat binding factor [Bogoriella megaspora]